mmetsp:Transcript_29765/g.70340  ORF Transcript_29765/g.70340 Transcript_29765/m.70340 type:complete len:189 (+) Transcript_29765:92-658(+)
MSAHIRVTRQGKAGSSERERGFSLSSAPAPLPSYDSLRDGNLRQYFETSSVQRLLQKGGWVDKGGRIVDLDKFKGKLNIIEQEFKYAEKTEFWRLKEEEEMRRAIQMKRERALMEAKRRDRARRIKEENSIRKSLISAVRNQAAHDIAKTSVDLHPEGGYDSVGGGAQSARGRVENSGGFFVTQAPGE